MKFKRRSNVMKKSNVLYVFNLKENLTSAPKDLFY